MNFKSRHNVIWTSVVLTAICLLSSMETRADGDLGEPVPAGYVRHLVLSHSDLDLDSTVPGRMRQYLVHLPPGSPPSGGWPVVLYFHGSLENEWIAAYRLASLKAKADSAGFLLVFPNGTASPASPTLPTRFWNTEDYRTDLPNTDDVQFTNEVIDDLLVVYPQIDSTRIYATGMSGGAMLAQLLGCELPHRIAAIASISGHVPWTGYAPFSGFRSARTNCPVAAPVIHFHGTADPSGQGWDGIDRATCLTMGHSSSECVDRHPVARPYNQGFNPALTRTDVEVELEANGCSPLAKTTQVINRVLDGTTVEMTDYTDCGAAHSNRVRFFKIVNGGHQHPGWTPNDMDPATPEIIRLLILAAEAASGKTTYDIRANDELWKFLSQFHL